jgi:hypothetical protein
MSEVDTLITKYQLDQKLGTEFENFKNDLTEKLKSVNKCIAITGKGTQCTKGQTEGQHCKIHAKKVTVTKTPGTSSNKCHGLLKNKSQCTEETSKDKPEGAKFHYCFRHIKKWAEFEKASE